MRIAGVVAEYNPFHNGHRYHLGKTREAGATHIVAVLSPAVVQRGDIAVMPVQERAERAVRDGADLVLELSPQWVLSPARDFARAGVGVLRRLGCIDMLSFGAETADIKSLRAALENIEAKELEIKALMSQGFTYPQAAAKACKEDTAKIISGQNNTLAVEYLRALRETDITPLAIQRTVLHDGNIPDGLFASASYIRKIIETDGSKKFLGYSPEKEQLSYLKNGEKAILWRLSMMSREDFGDIPNSDGLDGRFFEATRRAGSLEEVCGAVKNRSITHARVRRAVICAALGIKKDDMYEQPFARIIALNSRGAEILKICRETAKIGLGGSLAALSRLSPAAKRQAELIELASRLQSLCRRSGVGKSEYRQSAKMIK